MNGYSTFPKDLRLEPHYQMVYCHIQDASYGGGSYPPEEMQSVYTKTGALPSDGLLPYPGH